MTDWYVSKGGDDSSNGLSWANSKQSMQGVFDIISGAGPHNIYVGAGVYNEGNLIPNSASSNTNIYIRCQGKVVFEGNGEQSFALLIGNHWTASTYYSYYLFNCEIRNYSTAVWQGTGNMRLRLDDCVVHDMPYVFGASANDNYYKMLYFYNCFVYNITTQVQRVSAQNKSTSNEDRFYGLGSVFKDCTGGLFSCPNTVQPGGRRIHLLRGCVLINCGTAFDMQHTASVSYSVDEHWVSADTNHQFVLVDSTTTFAYTNYVHQINPNPKTYNTFAEFQQDMPGRYEDSYTGLVAADILADSTRDIPYLKEDLPYSKEDYGIGSDLGIDGTGGGGVPLIDTNASSRRNTWNLQSSFDSGPAGGKGWVSSDADMTFNANNNFQGIGTLTSPVFDLGAVYDLHRFRIDTTDNWPTEVIDLETSDSEPNSRNIEYRVSDNFFAQDAGSPSWTTWETNTDLSAISGRYVQVRLTFRDDGVAG